MIFSFKDLINNIVNIKNIRIYTVNEKLKFYKNECKIISSSIGFICCLVIS